MFILNLLIGIVKTIVKDKEKKSNLLILVLCQWCLFSFAPFISYSRIWSDYLCQRLIVQSLLQASMVKDAPISVSRVAWSPDGNFIGMVALPNDIYKVNVSTT